MRGLTTAAIDMGDRRHRYPCWHWLLGARRSGTIAALAVLSVFRVIENRLPSEFYAHHHLRFKREAVIPEESFVI